MFLSIQIVSLNICLDEAAQTEEAAATEVPVSVTHPTPAVKGVTDADEETVGKTEVKKMFTSFFHLVFQTKRLS